MRVGMNSILLVFAVLVSITLGPGAGAEESDGYVSLAMPPAELLKVGERCPVRVELALPELEVGGEEVIVGALARYVHCQGVRISHLNIEARKGPIDLVELVASARVIAPKGRDSAARLEYEFESADGEVHSASQFLDLDEGEINWDDGGSVLVPGTVDVSSLRLRVELTSPAER
jgi:hypothetical protein